MVSGARAARQAHRAQTASENAAQEAVAFTRPVTVLARRGDQLVSFTAKAKPAAFGTTQFTTDIKAQEDRVHKYEASAADAFVSPHPFDYAVAQATCDEAVKGGAHPPVAPNLQPEEGLPGFRLLGPAVSGDGGQLYLITLEWTGQAGCGT